MINITKKELLKYLERYANGDISMPQLIKELESDYRTLNNKIIEISIDNPDLYYKIIMTHPYQQRSRTDIDFEGLMIYIMKKGINIEQAVETFNISRRTIQRRVNDIKNVNSDLYELFKATVGRTAKKKLEPDLQERIDELEYKTVVIGEVNDEREKFLESLERRFNELVMSGYTREQAAKQMGYSNNYLWKALNELYRIKIEKNIKKQGRPANEFKCGLSDMTRYSNETGDNNIGNKIIKDRNNESR